MTELSVVKIFDKGNILTKPTVPYVFADHFTEETEILAKDIVEALYKNNGLGISANQLGLPWSIFAFKGDKEDYVVFNPRVVSLTGRVIKMDEGCLSFPNLIVPIKRFEEVRIRFSGPNNEVTSKTFKGITSRVVQHEIFHLEGRMWFEGCNKLHLERAMRASRKTFDYASLGLMKYAKKI